MAHYCPYSPLITGEYLRVTSHELLKKQRDQNVCMVHLRVQSTQVLIRFLRIRISKGSLFIDAFLKYDVLSLSNISISSCSMAVLMYKVFCAIWKPCLFNCRLAQISFTEYLYTIVTSISLVLNTCHHIDRFWLYPVYVLSISCLCLCCSCSQIPK